MCLIITVTVTAAKASDLRSLAGPAGTFDPPLEIVYRGPIGPHLHLCPADEGCGCAMLADSADWRSAAWSLEERWLPGIAAAFRSMYDKAPRGLSVTALWAGEPVRHTERVTIDHLAGLVESNQLGNWTKYIIAKPAS